MQEFVTLILPAKEKELPVVRLTTAGIASRLQMDWETMEDVKTAVYEACYAMTKQRWAPQQLRIEFSMAEPFSAVIYGEGELTKTDSRVPEPKLCRAVLEAMIPKVTVNVSDETISSISLSR